MEFKKINKSFYERNTLVVAKDLLGKYIIKKDNSSLLISRITEVEAYNGPEDKACHSYGNKVTKRNKVMFGPAGYVYVYLIYGMYYCFNIVTEDEGRPCAVLIRGVEPVEGKEQMSINRFGKPLLQLSNYQKKNFSNGPGKLCNALNITKSHNGIDLCGNEIYIAQDNNNTRYEILAGPRINIDYAEEYKDKPWRFYIKNRV